MSKERIKEIISGLTTDTDSPERIEAYNEIISIYDSMDTDKLQADLAEANKKYNDLEERYRSTFKTVLEGGSREEVIEEVVEEKEATWDDIFI